MQRTGFIVVVCAERVQDRRPGEYVDDSVITAKVKAAIFDDASRKVNEINVEERT